MSFRSSSLRILVVLFFALSGCSSDSSDAPPAATTTGIECSVSADGCLCEITTTQNDYSCSNTSLPNPGLCCADVGWPKAGSCSCVESTGGCENSPADLDYLSCSCSKTRTGSVSGCSSTSTGVCCKSPEGAGCGCYKTATECVNGWEIVASCKAEDYKNQCESTTEVATCSKATH